MRRQAGADWNAERWARLNAGFQRHTLCGSTTCGSTTWGSPTWGSTLWMGGFATTREASLLVGPILSGSAFRFQQSRGVRFLGLIELGDWLRRQGVAFLGDLAFEHCIKKFLARSGT